jgi:hypothetical protein
MEEDNLGFPHYFSLHMQPICWAAVRPVTDAKHYHHPTRHSQLRLPHPVVLFLLNEGDVMDWTCSSDEAYKKCRTDPVWFWGCELDSRFKWLDWRVRGFDRPTSNSTNGINYLKSLLENMYWRFFFCFFILPLFFLVALYKIKYVT